MALIAVGGFQHETNTFAPTKVDYRAFEAGAGRPGVQFGAAVAAWSRAPIFLRSGRGPDIKRQR